MLSSALLRIWIWGINVDPNYKDEIEITDTNISMQDIAYKLMDKHLSHFKSLSVGSFERLKDYKINSIRTVQNNDEPIIKNNGGSGFSFYVNFSFKPIDYTSDICITGNGIKGKNGWIDNEFRYIVVIKTGNIYTIKSIATGP